MKAIPSTSPDRLALGIDVGGTKIEAAIVAGDGSVLRQKRVAAPKDYDTTRTAILELIATLRDGAPLLGVGFSIPGSIDPVTQKLRNAPNSPAINGTPFFKELAQAIDLPVRCENDANCLTLSEFRFGAARGFKNVVGVILGSGVGGGVILDGKLFVGHRGLAPEIGHLPLDINGRRCLCGNTGCVEAYLSGHSLLRRYHDAGGNAAVNDTRTLFGLVNDAIANAVIADTRRFYVHFVAMLVSIYDPEIVVLGGGLSLQSLFYECNDAIARHVFGEPIAPKIVPATGGDASGKRGAAALFFP